MEKDKITAQLLAACEAVLAEYERYAAMWSGQRIFGAPCNIVDPPYLPQLRSAIAAAKGESQPRQPESGWHDTTGES